MLTPVTPIALSGAFGSVDFFLFLIKEGISTSGGNKGRSSLFSQFVITNYEFVKTND